MALEQTKGSFKVAGRVKGLANDNAMREGVTGSEKEYKALRFMVETSETNAVAVELFGMIKDNVYAYSSKDKKSKKLDWDERFEDHGHYKVMGVQVGLEQSKGKNVRKTMQEYDVIDYIVEHLSDGDFVQVSGDLNYSTYKTDEGEQREQKQLSIRNLYLTKEIDFEAEDFKEVCHFEQTIIISETSVNKEDKENPKLDVFAKVIDYSKDVTDTVFTIDAKAYPKLAQNMNKRLKFGDEIKVFGKIVNAVEYVEAEGEDAETEVEDWGGDEEVVDTFNKNMIRNYTNEMQITNVDSTTYEQKKYTEEDFVSEEEDNFGGDDFDESDDPFAEDLGDDDLPFG